MSATFNTLPDLIIEEILRLLGLKNQLKLRFCNRRISRLLKHIVFEQVPLPKVLHPYNNASTQNEIREMAPQIGKYIKRLRYRVDTQFFEVMDQYPNLEHIEVSDYYTIKVIDRLHSLDIKLKSFDLYLLEPFPTRPQFNFNHILKYLVKLDLTLRNEESKRLDILEMFQIPNLKTLNLTTDHFPEDTLVTINRNFPELKILYLACGYNLPSLILTPTTFLKLKRLKLALYGMQNFHRFPFQSFPQLKFLDYADREYIGDRALETLKENVFNQLLAISIGIFKLEKADVLNFSNLKYAKLYLGGDFTAKSMRHLLTLPNLSRLALYNNVSDSLFQDVMCTSPLSNLELLNHSYLSHQFLKFLQTNPPLTRLLISSFRGRNVFKPKLLNKFDKAFNLNLLFLEVNSWQEKFIDWVKARSPNVCILYLDDED